MRDISIPSSTHHSSILRWRGRALMVAIACTVFFSSAQAQFVSPFDQASDPCAGVTEKAMVIACDMARDLDTTPSAAYAAMSMAVPLYAARRCGFGVTPEFERDIISVTSDEKAYDVLSILMNQVLPQSESSLADFKTFCDSHRESYGPQGVVARYYQ